MLFWATQFLVGRKFPRISRFLLLASLVWMGYRWWRDRRRGGAPAA